MGKKKVTDFGVGLMNRKFKTIKCCDRAQKTNMVSHVENKFRYRHGGRPLTWWGK